jgi:hypothetical protein
VLGVKVAASTVGDYEGGRHRPGARPGLQYVGGLPALPCPFDVILAEAGIDVLLSGHHPHQGIANVRPLYPLPRTLPIRTLQTTSTSEDATPGRHPPRIRTRRLTCMDGEFGKGNVGRDRGDLLNRPRATLPPC